MNRCGSVRLFPVSIATGFLAAFLIDINWSYKYVTMMIMTVSAFCFLGGIVKAINK